MKNFLVKRGCERIIASNGIVETAGNQTVFVTYNILIQIAGCSVATININATKPQVLHQCVVVVYLTTIGQIADYLFFLQQTTSHIRQNRAQVTSWTITSRCIKFFHQPVDRMEIYFQKLSIWRRITKEISILEEAKNNFKNQISFKEKLFWSPMWRVLLDKLYIVYQYRAKLCITSIKHSTFVQKKYILWRNRDV